MIKKLLLCLCLALAPLCFSSRPELLENVPFGKVALDGGGDALRISLAQDDKYRLKIGLDEIPSQVVESVLRYEDQYFYWHPGINPFSICRALPGLFGIGRRMGASTLTMQVARLKYHIDSSTISGKLRQMWEALKLERHYSKAQILEAYFNLAPYGGNIEGLGAAARVYFNKAPAALTPLEIRALAVVPQNPIKRNPIRGSGFQAARGRIEKIFNGPDGVPPPLAVRDVKDIKALAPHLVLELLEERPESAIKLCLERDLQTSFESILKNYIARYRRLGIENAACLLVNSENMRVVASVGSADFFSQKISGQVDGTRARRSPGSTLKPFIYALALDQGLIHPQTILPDSPRSYGGYEPENFDYAFRGPVTASDALKSSRNLPAILLAEKLRYPNLYDFLKSAEVKLPKPASHYGLALVLGGAETSMRELAALYCMLANMGYWQPLRYTSDQQGIAPKRLLSPEAAWLAMHMLERPEAYVRSGAAPVPVRFKTGTSNGLRDAWTCGIIGKYVLAVWIGNFDNSSNPHFIGAKAALPLFMEMASSLASSRSLIDRHKTLEADLNLNRVDVCAATGDIAKGQCADIAETILIPGVSPIRDSGIIRSVLVDKKTGMRACEGGQDKNEEIWLEFWPTDMLAIFEKAGIYKKTPPQWMPECVNSPLAMEGKAPQINLPKKGVTYYKSLSQADFGLPLKASADPGVKTLRWYADRRYIGTTAPGEVLYWRPGQTGRLDLAVVDDRGLSSRQKCQVAVTP